MRNPFKSPSAPTSFTNGTKIRLSEVIAALSYALDLTEGQAPGHAARSCLLGMRLAREMRLELDDSSCLFYALLLKDIGCSSNASQLTAAMGADDRATKQAFKTVDWSSPIQSFRYVWGHLDPNGSLAHKLQMLVPIALKGSKRGTREMIEVRCERGAKIARDLMLPEKTINAIVGLDELWNGSGHPNGLRGEEIPMLSRILSISQTFETFAKKKGVAAAYEVARARRGTWFDPTLVRVLETFENDEPFWEMFLGTNPHTSVLTMEPEADRTIGADAATLDRIAHGFAQVIDAKSPWTCRHSEGVSDAATGIAQAMGFPAHEVRRIRRAGLLHDIGKLGISNLILDKPGKLTDDERAEMQKHPKYTYELLKNVAGFSDLAELAASHHEKLNGKGYYRGLTAEQLTVPDRILCVADIYDALAADRPYRDNMNRDQVFAIIDKMTGPELCPNAVMGLRAYLQEMDKSTIAPAIAA